MAVTLPLRLDFGPNNSPLASGFVKYLNAVYAVGRGYGWETNSGLAGVDTGYSGNPLTQDCVRGTSSRFLLDLAASGQYEVKLTYIDPRQRADEVNTSINGVSGRVLLPQSVAAETRQMFADASGRARINLTAVGPTSTDYFGLAALEVVSTGPPPPPLLLVELGPDFTVSGQVVNFTPVITGGTPPYAKVWSYGDGTSGSVDTHTYPFTGVYTAQLRVADGGSPPQTSVDAVVVTIPSPAPTYSLTVDRSGVVLGETVTVTWTVMASGRVLDWVGIYAVGDPNTQFDQREGRGWTYTSGTATGTWQTAPAFEGDVEFRYLLHDGFTDVARSQPVKVKKPPEAVVTISGMTIQDDMGVVNFGSVTSGGFITRTFTVTNVGKSDLILGPLTITGASGS